jgi:hypothetical protein
MTKPREYPSPKDNAAMNTSPIERLITHPRRGWIVTTATFVTALLFLLPAVDSYNLEKARLDEISVELDKSRTEITRFESWQHRIEEQGELLNQLEARAFIGPQVEAFRTELVDLIRKSDCTMRRVRLSEPSYRGWMAEHDDPLLDQPPHDAEGETPYYLETRHLALSVEGALDRIQKLLGELHATNRLVHSAAMTIHRADGESDNVSIDIDLVLFNLLLKSAVET